MKNVPKLRFKGFSGEWQAKKLGDIAKISSGGTPSRGKPEYWGGDIPWVTTSLIDFNIIEKAEEYITEDGLKNSSAKLFPKNTLLMAMYGQGKTRGKIAILGFEATTNQACAAIILDASVVSGLFVFHNLFGRYNEIRDLSNAGGQENLSAGLIKSININFPALQEQTKIADFLAAVDDRISQLSQKCDGLAQYKKGVMQKIFSQELRFKDEKGRAFPAWEEKRLGECLDYIQPTKYLVSSTEYDNSFETPVLTAGKTFILGYTNEKNDIFTNGLPVIIFDDFTTATQFVNFPFKAKSSAMKILVATKNVNIRFIYGCMQVLKYEVGGHERHWISKFSNILLPIPSMAEQEKIAGFLGAVDEKISQAQAQHNALKQYKQGLLQQMFV